MMTMKTAVTALCTMYLADSISKCLAQPSQAASSAAANAVEPLGATWFMQPFEQCGGTGGVCSAAASAGIHTCADQQYPGSICPMTYTCQRQSEAFWQCLPAQLRPAAVGANATAGGRNRTATRAGSSIDDAYKPAHVENAGFRRYNITAWPYCAPWEYAIASRCVPANRTGYRAGGSVSGESSTGSARPYDLWVVWMTLVIVAAVELACTALL